MSVRDQRILIIVTVLVVSALSWLILRGSGRSALPELDSLNMYLVMVDRFEDGDATNNDANGRSDVRKPLAVQGGDLRGIEQRLPYLKSLGINAIWITPVQKNTPGAFHGYWIQHFKEIDPRLGDMKDLQQMIARAHEFGIRVYLDVVCNHTGPLIITREGRYEWNEDGYTLAWKNAAQLPTPKVLQNLDLYHPYGLVKEWEDPYQILGELSGGLNDLRTEDPRILAVMIDIWTWWMEQTNCDGFRVDTVKHVEMPFWHAWLKAIRRYAQKMRKPDFFIFGEVFSNSNEKCASYTKADTEGNRGFDAVYNFSLAEAVRDVFGRSESVARLTASIDDMHHYDTAARSSLLNFVDNHDMSRFMAIAESDTTALLNALTFLYTTQGIPLIYYGTEQAFLGGTGPDWENRECMFEHGWKGKNPRDEAFDTTTAVFRHLVALQEFRVAHPVLRQADMRVYFADTVANVFVLQRSMPKAQAYFLLNAGNTEAVVSLPSDEKGYQLWTPRLSLAADKHGERIVLSPSEIVVALRE